MSSLMAIMNNISIASENIATRVSNIPLFSIDEDKCYDSLNAAINELKNFAKEHKFAIKKSRSKGDTCVNGSYERICMACVHEGFNEGNGGGSTKRCGCTFQVAFAKSSKTNFWSITVIEGRHNHDSALTLAIYPMWRREYIEDNKEIIEMGLRSGRTASTIIDDLITNNQNEIPLITANDIYNYRKKWTMQLYGDRNPTQVFMEDILTNVNSSWLSRYRLDNDNRFTGIVLVKPKENAGSVDYCMAKLSL